MMRQGQDQDVPHQLMPPVQIFEQYSLAALDLLQGLGDVAAQPHRATAFPALWVVTEGIAVSMKPQASGKTSRLGLQQAWQLVLKLGALPPHMPSHSHVTSIVSAPHQQGIS